MRNLSEFYVFSILYNSSFAGFISSYSYNGVERVEEVVNITISDHLREVLMLLQSMLMTKDGDINSILCHQH